MKEWFKARNIWGAAILALSDAEAGRLAKALWAYTMSGEEQNLSGAEKGIFAMIQMTLSQDECQEADISRKRAEAGLRGARQKMANQAIASFATDEQANTANACNKNKSKNIEEDIKEKDKREKRFTPPTVDDVKAYCVERKNQVDPQRFVDFYASKGWKVGNQPMRDWKAAVRTWEQRDNTHSPPTAPKKVVAQDYTQRDYEDKMYDSPEKMLEELMRA